jgi:disulfide bond formation protein DsbB
MILTFIVLELSTSRRFWRLVRFIIGVFIQGVTTGLLANALQNQWKAIFFIYLLVFMFYCLEKQLLLEKFPQVYEVNIWQNPRTFQLDLGFGNFEIHHFWNIFTFRISQNRKEK